MTFPAHLSAVFLVVIVSLLAPATSVAATVTASYLGALDTLKVSRSVDGTVTANLTIGIFRFQQTGGTYDLPEGPEFYAFCVEPFEGVATGTFTFAMLEEGNTRQGGMGTARANRLRELFTRYAPIIHADLLDSVVTRALQVATWEIVRETDTTLNVLTGNTFFGHPTTDLANNAIRDEVYAQANVMLASLTGNPSDRLNNFYALTRVGNQDVIVMGTPEPSTLVLMSFGIVCLYVRRRRSQCRPSGTTH